MRVPSERTISLHFTDVSLANALRDRIAADAPDRRIVVVDDLVQSVRACGTLVTSTTQCSPAECAGLAEAGMHVIVLAAVPSEFQKGLYESAGAAAYLPMTLDLAPLIAAIKRVDPGGSP